MNKIHREVCAPWTARHVDVDGNQPRVLVVDDNVNAAQALSAYLSFEDIECRVAFGGVEAIKMATQWHPHVVVMDISMPECNGFEAAIELRKDERTQGIAIVAFTALDETEVRRHLADHEFDGYCQKGQPPSILFGLVTKFMKD